MKNETWSGLGGFLGGLQGRASSGLQSRAGLDFCTQSTCLPFDDGSSFLSL